MKTSADNIKQSRPASVAMSEFSQFMTSTLGKAVLRHEKIILNQQLPSLVAYNLLQLSALKAQRLCDSPIFESRIGHYIRMGFAPSLTEQSSDHLWADYQSLPVASDCVDIVLLHHVLEFSSQPHQLLREADRILTNGGHIVVLGFNPISSWSLYRFGMQWRYPWLKSQQCILRHRLHDWLSLLNYDVEVQKNYFYRPCISSSKVLDSFAFMDKVGRSLRLPMGLFYVMVAKKRAWPMTPAKNYWSPQTQPAQATVVNFKHAAEKLMKKDKSN